MFGTPQKYTVDASGTVTGQAAMDFSDSASAVLTAPVAAFGSTSQEPIHPTVVTLSQVLYGTVVYFVADAMGTKKGKNGGDSAFSRLTGSNQQRLA